MGFASQIPLSRRGQGQGPVCVGAGLGGGLPGPHAERTDPSLSAPRNGARGHLRGVTMPHGGVEVGKGVLSPGCLKRCSRWRRVLNSHFCICSFARSLFRLFTRSPNEGVCVPHAAATTQGPELCPQHPVCQLPLHSKHLIIFRNTSWHRPPEPLSKYVFRKPAVFALDCHDTNTWKQGAVARTQPHKSD